MNTWQIIIGTCENHFLKAQNEPLTPSDGHACVWTQITKHWNPPPKTGNPNRQNSSCWNQTGNSNRLLVSTVKLYLR